MLKNGLFDNFMLFSDFLRKEVICRNSRYICKKYEKKQKKYLHFSSCSVIVEEKELLKLT